MQRIAKELQTHPQKTQYPSIELQELQNRRCITIYIAFQNTRTPKREKGCVFCLLVFSPFFSIGVSGLVFCLFQDTRSRINLVVSSRQDSSNKKAALAPNPQGGGGLTSDDQKVYCLMLVFLRQLVSAVADFDDSTFFSESAKVALGGILVEIEGSD